MYRLPDNAIANISVFLYYSARYNQSSEQMWTSIFGRVRASEGCINTIYMATEKSTKKDFAIIETGGKQYIVSVGDVVEVELLGEMEDGAKVEFDKVLMTDDGTKAAIGTPYLEGKKVTAIFQGVKKGPKISIIRYKAKSNRDRKLGHRQKHAQVKIESI